MAQTKGSNFLFHKPVPTRSTQAQVTWAGPNAGKGRGSNGKGSKGRGSKKVKISEEGGRVGGAREAQKGSDSDEESYVEGSYELGGSSNQIKFQRKSRNASEGDYAKKPAPDARPTIQFLKNGKGFLAPKPKKTLRHIVRLKWDDNTLNTKGAKRAIFYNSCIKIFKEYYKYPKNYEPEDGDRVVGAHLKRNFKYYLNTEKSKLMKVVNQILECGYSKDEIKIREMKPYYFSQRAWNAICDHWGTPEFAMRSINGQKARMMVEFTPRTGAKPFDQRREEIDAEREEKGEMPIPDDEFLSIVYDPSEPAVKNIQEKMKVVRSSQAELTLESPNDQPPSPRTQKEFQRKKDLFVTIQAKPPKKGKLFLHPQETLAELIGAHEATQWIKQVMENSHAPVDVPDDIYLIMSRILDEVRQMVRSLPMREVKQSVLNEEISNLATAAFPDPSQQSLKTHYIRTATGLLHQILKDVDKIIIEETMLEKAMEVDKTALLDKTDEVDKAVDLDGTNEDEDVDAHNYPLF